MQILLFSHQILGLLAGEMLDGELDGAAGSCGFEQFLVQQGGLVGIVSVAQQAEGVVFLSLIGEDAYFAKADDGAEISGVFCGMHFVLRDDAEGGFVARPDSVNLVADEGRMEEQAAAPVGVSHWRLKHITDGQRVWVAAVAQQSQCARGGVAEDCCAFFLGERLIFAPHWAEFKIAHDIYIIRYVLSLRHYLQPYDGRYERGDEQQSPECGWLVENEDSQQHGAHGTDASPDGVGSAQRQVVGCVSQHGHTQD